MGEFLLFIINSLLGLLILAIFAQVIISWLVAFDVINLRNPMARQFVHFLDVVVAPVLKPLQRIIPPIGGIDITPLIALIIINGLRAYLLPWVFAPIIAAIG